MRFLRRKWYRFVEEAAASRGDFETARYYLARVKRWDEKEVAMKEIRKGSENWGDLLGTRFSVLFPVPWEEPEWLEVTLEGILLTHNEFGTPVYYLEGEHGGYMFYETDEVEVRFD